MSRGNFCHFSTALFALPVDSRIFQRVNVIGFEELNIMSTLSPQFLQLTPQPTDFLCLDFISSFQKHCIILFLQFSDVTKGLVQYHVLTLFKCLGTWQKITNAVNPGINLFFSVSFNCIVRFFVFLLFGFTARCLSFSHLWHPVLTVACMIRYQSTHQQLDLKSIPCSSCFSLDILETAVPVRTLKIGG